MNKSNLIFLDTETTGKGPNDRLCQVAYSFNGEEFDALFKPPIPIQVEAMAISHITNKIVEDKEPFIGSEFQKKLLDILSKENILVAHNAQFDVDMLRKENIEVGSAIDTLKIAHYLDKEAKIPKHGLQYLRYFLDLDICDVVPHSALGDVRVLEKLFERLFQKMLVEFKEESAVIDEMLRISALPILMKRFSFGKYNGSMVADIAKTDAGYLRWLLNEKNKAKEQEGINDENWIHTLEYYLQN
ncbi:MAG: exonuclease domain-containing protein [bacterium]|nr:exonuclease domain-containing protein [bacterium]